MVENAEQLLLQGLVNLHVLLLLLLVFHDSVFVALGGGGGGGGPRGEKLRARKEEGSHHGYNIRLAVKGASKHGSSIEFEASEVSDLYYKKEECARVVQTRSCIVNQMRRGMGWFFALLLFLACRSQ